MPMAGTVDPSAFVLFTAIWGIGMVAMMFPSLVPMVYAITISAKKEPKDPLVSTARHPLRPRRHTHHLPQQ
jgi:predicted metal-binding membrane protein